MTVNLCRHIKTNGLQCHGIQLASSEFCYFHRKLHRSHDIYRNQVYFHPARVDHTTSISLPVVEDRESAQLAISCVINALASGYIERKHANSLLYGLQLATTNIRGLRIVRRPTQMVRDFEKESWGHIPEACPDVAPPGRTVEIKDSTDPAVSRALSESYLSSVQGFGVEALGGVLKAGERVSGAGVESAADEAVGEGAAPAFAEAKAAVVVDAAMVRAKWDARQVLVDCDAEGEERIEDQAVVCGVDLHEVEGEFQVEESGAGFSGDGLSGGGGAGGVEGEDAQVVEVAPALGMGEEVPDEFDWSVDDGRGTAGVVHTHLGVCYAVWSKGDMGLRPMLVWVAPAALSPVGVTNGRVIASGGDAEHWEWAK